ncbi:hypothetical protein TR2A62_2469 [Thalassobium sp. R2A62]|nr:hypothetical protein TR2A62_2469 [Thalassobium sp. R2A62]
MAGLSGPSTKAQRTAEMSPICEFDFLAARFRNARNAA